MTGWLTKVTETFGTKTIEAPEPFQITCSCGKRSDGIRSEESQLVRCSNCKSMIFVLPKNPYPALKRGPSKKNKNKLGETITKPKSDNSTHVEKKRISQKVKEKVSKIKTRTRERTVRLIQKQKDFFTPFRLIILFTAFLVSLTGYWVFYSNRLESAGAIFQVSIKEGQKALESKDFLLAEKEFGKANEALLILNQESPEAHDAHIYFLEINAYNHLVPKSLIEMIELASKPQLPGEPSWENDFQTNYYDKWIILDTVFYRKSLEGSQEIFALESPFLANNVKIILKTDLSRLVEYLGTDTSRRIVIGAQLKSCKKTAGIPLPDGNAGIVTIELDPESIFLWSHPELLSEIGLIDDSDKEIKQLLEIQSRFTGLNK
jgi:hypothetical protein